MSGPKSKDPKQSAASSNQPPDLRAKWVVLDKTKALKMLEANTDNRPIAQSAVERYARDMKAGRWSFTAEPIQVAADGRIVDGQHRLWAIVIADIEIWMYVVTGVPFESQKVIDDNLPRRPWSFGPDKGRSFEFAVLRALLTPMERGNNPGLSNEHMRELMEKHRAAVTFAVSAFQFRPKRVVTARVVGVIARAYYQQSLDKDAIRSFCNVLATGEVRLGEKDKRLNHLRDVMIRIAKPDSPTVTAGKIETALVGYCKGRMPKVVKAAQTELFPFPGEEAFRKTLVSSATRKLAVDRPHIPLSSTSRTRLAIESSLKNKPATIAEMAKLSSATKPALFSACQRLEAEGVIRRAGTVKGTKGGKPVVVWALANATYPIPLQPSV